MAITKSIAAITCARFFTGVDDLFHEDKSEKTQFEALRRNIEIWCIASIKSGNNFYDQWHVNRSRDEAVFA